MWCGVCVCVRVCVCARERLQVLLALDQFNRTGQVDVIFNDHYHLSLKPTVGTVQSSHLSL